MGNLPSLARDCKKEGILWVQFFINRNNETTTNPRVYFPSIARHMAEHSSNSIVSKKIYDILKMNPILLDRMSNCLFKWCMLRATLRRVDRW